MVSTADRRGAPGIAGSEVTMGQTVHPASEVDIVVIGAGQAGLSAAHHLQRTQVGSMVVLDAEDGPGGAWRHRWDSLTMATVNNIFDLPGLTQQPVDPDTPSNLAVPEYFARFEQTFELPILRPVRVRSVANLTDAADSPLLVTATDGRAWQTRVVVNATGTWTQPHVPWVPGMDQFAGTMVHTATYRRATDFAGQRVGVVGAGISAVGHLAEISRVARTFWFTRTPPLFRDTPFDREAGAEVVAKVDARVRQGYPPLSVVRLTGLPRRDDLVEAQERGVLEPLPMFTAMDATGVITAGGEHIDLDAIVWATGFRAELRHLAPLHLTHPNGGIVMDPPQVAGDPRLYLVGYGPSASTVGANRSGRVVASRVRRYLQGLADHSQHPSPERDDNA